MLFGFCFRLNITRTVGWVFNANDLSQQPVWLHCDINRKEHNPNCVRSIMVVEVAFSSHSRIFFGKIDDSYPSCAFLSVFLLLFVSVPFFFFRWRCAREHQYFPLGQDQSTVAQQAETTSSVISGGRKKVNRKDWMIKSERLTPRQIRRSYQSEIQVTKSHVAVSFIAHVTHHVGK